MNKEEITKKEKSEKIEVTERGLKEVVTGIAQMVDVELFSTPQEGLEERYYHFRWDENKSVEWNAYLFNDLLSLYSRRVSRWEEFHNGPVCVVERVRDRYLMPKVREFLLEVDKHRSKISPTEKKLEDHEKL